MNEQQEERLLDLLCKQVSEVLTIEEQRELEKLESSVETSVDLSSLEMTAAAIAMSSVGTDEVLPDHLKSGILTRADEYFANARTANEPKVRAVQSTNKPSMSVWGWLGWAAAAVACIALSVNIYQNNGRRDDRAALQTPTPTPEILTPTQSRDRLMASASDVVTADWGAGNVAGLELAGDIVWSDSKQEGYMRFRNLPKNDVTKYTYQLWIFDETQDPKTPIDGGIFDVNADGEVVIPIDAKLRARGAKAFAITMEKPGGVMVSGRKQLVSLAQVKPSSA
jgi:anti-sigma-K factor RskA